MAGPRQRYWPSLYDRLLQGDARGIDDHFVDADTLRDNVRRDLQILLNTTSFESVSDLSRHDRVRASVLNYGVPDLPGQIVTGISEWKLREKLAEAVRRYEPRIAPDSISVQVDTGDEDNRPPDSPVLIDPERGVTLSISGKVYGTPEEYIQIETHLDIAMGQTGVTVI